jgi:uncharacterized membrane protein
MADMMDPVPAQNNSAAQASLESLKQLTLIIYILYGLTLLTAGLTGVVGVMMNYIKRDAVRGTIYESHFTWQIRTFWWSSPLFIIGILTKIIVIGFFIFGAVFLWWLYRMIKGGLNWVDGKPM